MSRREENIVEVDSQEESLVNEHDLEEDEEKVQQWKQCLQTRAQQEDNFQVNTCSHQLTIKEERHEDHEGSLILGQPCLSFASCVLDMGKGKLELNVEDQKISFDLIEEIKHPVNGEDWFEAEISEQEMELTASAMVLQTPGEKEFEYVTECLVNEDGGRMLACIEELGDLDDESIGHVMFEELENN